MVSISGSMLGVNAGVDASLKSGISGHLSFGTGVFSRTLTFRAKDLGTDATLMLVFDKGIDGLYKDKFPVCWDQQHFPAQGPGHVTTTFTSQPVFFKPVVVSDVIEASSTSITIKAGQKTTLTKEESGVIRFTDPESDQGSNVMKAYNGTQGKEDICIGIVPSGGMDPVPMLYFNGVGAGMFVQVDHAPVLSAYITSQYKKKQIIRGEIPTPAIWQQNLGALEANTTWDVKYDAATGKYTITKA